MTRKYNVIFILSLVYKLFCIRTKQFVYKHVEWLIQNLMWFNLFSRPSKWLNQNSFFLNIFLYIWTRFLTYLFLSRSNVLSITQCLLFLTNAYFYYYYYCKLMHCFQETEKTAWLRACILTSGCPYMISRLAIKSICVTLTCESVLTMFPSWYHFNVKVK